MDHESDIDTNCNWCTRNNPQRTGKWTGKLGNKRTGGDYPDNTIIKIRQHTEKSPGDFRRLAVAPSPV